MYCVLFDYAAVRWSGLLSFVFEFFFITRTCSHNFGFLIYSDQIYPYMIMSQHTIKKVVDDELSKLPLFGTNATRSNIKATHDLKKVYEKVSGKIYVVYVYEYPCCILSHMRFFIRLFVSIST